MLDFFTVWMNVQGENCLIFPIISLFSIEHNKLLDMNNVIE